MSDTRAVPYLAPPLADRAAYEQLYALIHRVDEVFHGDPSEWQTTRIPAGLTALQVYKLLPAAPDQEYGGYLTRTRIRFVPGWEEGAYIVAAKDTTWHSHPLRYPLADIPSFTDVYSFLRYRNRRHITVGAKTIWTLDKTEATLAAVGRLNRYEVRHMVEAIARVGFEDYHLFALQSIGLRPLPALEEFQQVWPQLLKEDLAIQVEVFDKEQAPWPDVGL
jgi:hypothetical protein